MDYIKLPRKQLLNKCSDLNIKKYKSKNKAQLVKLLLQYNIAAELTTELIFGYLPTVNVKTEQSLINISNNDKSIIIERFMNRVKGVQIPKFLKNKHCGKEGHWLETLMEIKHNCRNLPDLYGYEMKKYSPKITFGDFSASEYLFSKNRSILNKLNKWNADTTIMTRTEFIKYFGTPNPAKQNRYSWSGTCIPTYGEWNFCGQILLFTNKLDLYIMYSYKKDTRKCKKAYPQYLQKGNIYIAFWENTKLKNCINKKYNQNGFFLCKKDKTNTYQTICFGKAFDYEFFVQNIKNKNIIFDSGMYTGNSRNYSQFRSRASNFWDALIVEVY